MRLAPVVAASLVVATGAAAVPAVAASSADRPPDGSPDSTANRAVVTQPTAEFFDDFAYTDSADPRLAERQWNVRTGAGGPGVPGASWSADHVTFPAIDSGKALQLEASSNGTAEGTTQSEVHHQRKFFEGTYGARVRFTDTPTSGPDGDQMVQTFFTITPLDAPNDPDYGEIDFEYLPNGGWGMDQPTMFMTTWETYQPEPPTSDNLSDTVPGSQQGWHDLVFQVTEGSVRYYLDGDLVAEHGGEYYPETPMSINLNHWFIDGGLVDSAEERSYVEQVDWVYHTKDENVAPDQVPQRVQAFRADNVEFHDTVPAP